MSEHPKVALIRCATYDRPELPAILERLLAHLGGLGAFVKPGQSVLLKPNLLTERAPEAAVTTHPEVVRALLGLVRQCGGTPTVADSPASAVNLARVWEKTGMSAVCREENTPLISLEQAGSVPFLVDGHAFSVAKPVLEADVVIGVCKVKTHSLTTLTGAVKNVFGTVPGYQKVHLHKQHPTPAAFGRLLAAVYQAVRPALHIADGIVGMEGAGPSAGDPVALGLLAASADGVALDLALCRLLGIRPQAVPYLNALLPDEAARRRYHVMNLVGAAPHEVGRLRFRVPNTLPARLIPAPLVRLLAPLVWVRPAVSGRCVRCGQCLRACPVGALALPDDGPARLTPAKCIGCCCCHEICPEKAIAMTQSPLLNLVRRGKML